MRLALILRTEDRYNLERLRDQLLRRELIKKGIIRPSPREALWRSLLKEAS